MAEQLSIENQDWEMFEEERELVLEQDYRQWLAGVEDPEEIDRQCRFWMAWKRFGNTFQQAAIDRRVELVKQRDHHIVQSGEQLFRPDVRRRMIEERQDFWERHQ